MSGGYTKDNLCFGGLGALLGKPPRSEYRVMGETRLKKRVSVLTSSLMDCSQPLVGRSPWRNTGERKGNLAIVVRGTETQWSTRKEAPQIRFERVQRGSTPEKGNLYRGTETRWKEPITGCEPMRDAPGLRTEGFIGTEQKKEQGNTGRKGNRDRTSFRRPFHSKVC